jgi:cytoskeletal protein CcmA (bactofilin family)
MWKDEMREKDGIEPAPPALESRPRPESRPTMTRGGGATIGPSISIHGDVTGDEDLLIEGRVDGSVTLDLHSVTVGGQGRVKANITGRIITIEGEVDGDLTAQEQIILRSSSRVAGDLRSPRVVLEDGANFRGLVDMSARQAEAKATAAQPRDKDENGRTESKDDAGGTGGAAGKEDAAISSPSSSRRPSGAKGASGAADSAHA